MFVLAVSRRARRLTWQINQALSLNSNYSTVRLSPKQQELARRAVNARIARMRAELSVLRAQRPSKALRLAAKPRLAYRIARIGAKKAAKNIASSASLRPHPAAVSLRRRKMRTA